MSLRTRYLATTLALLAIGLGFGLSQGRTRPAPPRPPARDAHVPARLVLPPTAEEILGRAEALQLRPGQATRLRKLADEWRVETERLEAALQAASAEFDQFAAGARRGGGASVPELQRRSADLQALSAELRERRAAHSLRAVEILTDAQRELLRRESGNQDPEGPFYGQGATPPQAGGRQDAMDLTGTGISHKTHKMAQGTTRLRPVIRPEFVTP